MDNPTVSLTLPWACQPGVVGARDPAQAPPLGFLDPYVGSNLDWAAVLFDSAGNSVVGPVGFEVRL